ncbi:hypothetical protein [Domibacillus indicus]|uniref:hypothetical protein n=1 Tax=Domibacillus indicus TaxID=1437523 RepID=UPI000617D7F6|nr:hypothetical protein [Domibacillus indicus]
MKPLETLVFEGNQRRTFDFIKKGNSTYEVMKMKRAETLEDFIELVESAAGRKSLFTSEQESPLPDAAIGDEDSGEAIAITVQALLECSSESVYFSATYNDSVHYEEAVKQLKELERLMPSQKVIPSEIQKRVC